MMFMSGNEEVLVFNACNKCCTEYLSCVLLVHFFQSKHRANKVSNSGRLEVLFIITSEIN